MNPNYTDSEGNTTTNKIESVLKRLEEIRAEEKQLLSVLENLKTNEKNKCAEQNAAELDYEIFRGLDSNDIMRYSRHLLLPQIRSEGQYKIKKSKVLVIGAGGLGSTVLLYLCAMGVGKIGVVDFDSVESSNLHRQIIHKENTAGLPKVESAKRAMNELNSGCKVETYNTHLNSSNALEIFEKYDVVVDASDNLPTRYLINDACVITKKPLVYGSALRLDGQVVKYNYKGGPCYRCMFPKPPPFDKKASCSEAGVLGVVPGLIGCIQALEVIKIVLSADSPQPTSSYMLSFSTYGNPQFRQFRIRNRRPDCEVCGESPTITSLIDYPAFCGADSTDMAPVSKVLEKSDPCRISCMEYSKVRKSGQPHILLDVRDTDQFQLCSFRGSRHIPLDRLVSEGQEYANGDNSSTGKESQFKNLVDDAKEKNLPIYAICRRGNLSQSAVKALREFANFEKCYQIDGGITAWNKTVDNGFPFY